MLSVGYVGTEADHFDQGSQSSRVSRNVGSAAMSSKEIRSTEKQDKTRRSLESELFSDLLDPSRLAQLYQGARRKWGRC